MQMMLKPKFKVGDLAYVVDKAEYTTNNETRRIPLGTEAKVRSVSLLKSRGYPDEVRYEINFNGGPLICWVDEGCLTGRILDIACAA